MTESASAQVAELDVPTFSVLPCERCGLAPGESDCCSSHQKWLCHKCYRVTHFVEVCGASCTKCQAEGLLRELHRG